MGCERSGRKELETRGRWHRRRKVGVGWSLPRTLRLKSSPGQWGGWERGRRERNDFFIFSMSFCRMMLPYVLLYLSSRCRKLTKWESAEARYHLQTGFPETADFLPRFGIHLIQFVSYYSGRQQGGSVVLSLWLMDGACSSKVGLCEIAFHTLGSRDDLFPVRQYLNFGWDAVLLEKRKAKFSVLHLREASMRRLQASYSH